MSRAWDIPQTERIFNAHQDIIRPLSGQSSRLAPNASSMPKVGIVIGFMAVSSVSANVIIPSSAFGSISDQTVMVERSAFVAKKGPMRQKTPGIDFSRSRTPQQLAAGFRGMFRPAADMDDSAEEGFVF